VIVPSVSSFPSGSDSRTRRLLPDIKAATEEDWRTEYEAPILSIRVVDDLDTAVDHIAKYGSQHTDAIVNDLVPNRAK
jgi:glutamate-5-semialdehyde dehydrogenase